MSLLSVLFLFVMSIIVTSVDQLPSVHAQPYMNLPNQMMNRKAQLLNALLNGHKVQQTNSASVHKSKLSTFVAVASSPKVLKQGMTCSDGSFRDIIPGSYCMYEQDCINRYSYSTCDWYGGMQPGLATTQKMCFCRCGYRWDPTSTQCINNNCWFCSSGVIMAIVIVILVIVIIVAIFTIPTCALVSCMGSKQ